MLRGLDVEPEPDRACPQSAPELLYEDRWIAAVFKPAGMLSVPGNRKLRRSSTGLGSVIPQLRDRSSSTASIWTPRVYYCSP